MQYYIYNRPENKVHHENPVRFTWYPLEDAEQYRICVFNEQNEIAYEFKAIDINFYTPSIVMEPGKYTYSVYAGENEFVCRQAFEISKDAVETPLFSREQRYESIGGHPRIWLNKVDIDELSLKRQTSLKTTWEDFIEKAANPWLTHDIHQEPDFYPNNIRQVDLWRTMYIECQEALYAIKHCAVAWRVTKERQYLDVAKSWLLEIASWDVNGATARSYNDESSFRVTAALAWGYDWLYDDLSSDEKERVQQTLLLRGRELYQYVRDETQIHIKLLDSHGVRSLSMTLIPAALALYGEAEEAKEWLNYALEYFFTIFTPWGGEDGGWAEGPAYWQTGISLFTEAICLIRKATGIDVFNRPFFQNTGDFPLYTYSQDIRHMAFGDQSDLGDYPGLKAGYTMRILGAVSNSPNRNLYAWYYEEAKRRRIGTQDKFYNYGWWNFEFDELFFEMLFDPIEAKAPTEQVMLKWFKDIGWVCLHKDMADDEKHIAFMFKASPFGSVSHSHGDQNAFVLHAFGQPLLIQSGYYIGFRSDMHIKWRRETKSKNGILIDGTGQYVQMQPRNVAEELNGSAQSHFEDLIGAKGVIEACVKKEHHIYMRGDATQAFEKTVPYLNSYKREISFIDESFFVITDHIDLAKEGKIDWLLHSLSPFELGHNQASLVQEGVYLDVYLLGEQMDLSQTNEFDKVDPKEIVGLDPQWHLKATTINQAKSFKIVSVLYPYKAGQKKALTVQGGENPTIIFDGKEYGQAYWAEPEAIIK